MEQIDYTGKQVRILEDNPVGSGYKKGEIVTITEAVKNREGVWKCSPRNMHIHTEHFELIKSINNEELLTEARHRYPIGTRFVPAHTQLGINEVTGNIYGDINSIECSSIHIKAWFSGCLYYNGKWAEIINKPEERPHLQDSLKVFTEYFNLEDKLNFNQTINKNEKDKRESNSIEKKKYFKSETVTKGTRKQGKSINLPTNKKEVSRSNRRRGTSI